MPEENKRETGTRALRQIDRPDTNQEVSQEAAENRKSRRGIDNTEPSSEHDETTRHNDGQRPRRSRK
jgi:hypothetical protein